MENPKPYFVPYEAFAEDHFVEKKSKFIGRMWRVESQEEAVAKIKEMKEKHWDANHNCSAYILREGNVERYSDDGEPQGTAGVPMLEVLRHAQLTNVCCVVTRYFGGVLLGTGGLVRAYTQGVQVAMAAAGKCQMSLFAVLLVACPYNLFEQVKRVLVAHDCSIEDTEYGADITITAYQLAGNLEVLNQALAEISAGTIIAEEMEVQFMGRRVD